VETALCFLLVFVTIYAIMEFGLFVYSYNVVAGATREGARYAIVHGSRSGAVASEADIRAQILRWCVGLNPSALVVRTTWLPENTPGSRVRIDTAYTLNPMTALIVSAPLTIRSSSEMVISQ
jgi:Flp pilus assembly protein TadG